MNFNFDWESMTGGEDVFAAKTAYETDDRFYILPKDDKGNGAAIIRFLPSEILENGSMRTIKQLYKYNVRSKTSKRFLAIWSPTSIGKPDPIQEKWAQLWNANQKEEAKRYARSERYIANILVIKDPKCPENEGKVFLLDMSKSFKTKIQSWIQPSAQEIALGTKPKNLFNPLAGYNVKYLSYRDSNGYITYDKSEVAPDETAIFKSGDEAAKFIDANCYKLSEWDLESAYPSYDEIKEKLENLDVVTTEKVAENVQAAIDVADVPFDVNDTPKDEMPAPKAKSKVDSAPESTDDLDALIKSLA